MNLYLAKINSLLAISFNPTYLSPMYSNSRVDTDHTVPLLSGGSHRCTFQGNKDTGPV